MNISQWSTLVVVLALVSFSHGFSSSAEKLRLATPNNAPNFALPMLAAEEKGFWKQNGVEVEWVVLSWARGISPGIAAGALELAIADALSPILGIARGSPEIIIADLAHTQDFHIWVRADSKISRPEELAGMKIGVPSMGTSPAAYVRLMSNAAGLKKPPKLLAMGSIPTRMAALKTGVIDAVPLTIITVANQAAAGEIRSILSLKPYLPQTWISFVLFGHSGFIENNPDKIRRAINAALRATDFLVKNKSWVEEKLRTYSGYSAKAAELIREDLIYGKGGRVERKAVETVLQFMTEYGLIRKEEIPPIERLFTNRLVE